MEMICCVMEAEVKMCYFEAVMDLSSPVSDEAARVVLLIQGMRLPAELYPYTTADGPDTNSVFAQVHSSRPLLLKWKDVFRLQGEGGSGFHGEGRVLNPNEEKIQRSEFKKREELLRGLSGTEKEMLRAKSLDKGIHGITEEELISFCSLSRETLLQLGKQLEEEGALKIVSFSPLLFLSQGSLNFLCGKILAFLSHFHGANPGEIGAPLEKIGQKFNLHPRILSLALKHLLRTGEVKDSAERIALSHFQIKLSPEEERLLVDLEAMALQGSLHSISFDELKERFHLSTKNLNKLLVFLIERKKIVLGKDGFIVHSKWLEEIIQNLREGGKRDLSVTEFKQMTGLSRKYAIPLLELLDQMGVTRRRGSYREIL